MTEATLHTPRVLFSSTLFTPFIEEDHAILSRHFPVDTIIEHGFPALVRLPRGVLRSDIALSWFGSVYAGYMVLLAKLMRRRSIVVVAGVDASKDAEIHYGIWLNPWKAAVVRYAFKNADRVIVVDPFLQREAKRLAGYDGANIVNIPFGFDGERWIPGKTKTRQVVTVAACEDEWKFRKKGIDKLFEAAKQLPDVRFTVIGIRDTVLPRVAQGKPENVELIAYVPRSAILPYLQAAKVYCQPSFTEGLPNALCEAMLCGCIPVGTIAGGIPTAIGPMGFLVPYGDVAALVTALRQALDAPDSRGNEARARILKEFTISRRENALVATIQELSG